MKVFFRRFAAGPPRQVAPTPMQKTSCAALYQMPACGKIGGSYIGIEGSLWHGVVFGDTGG